MNRLIFFACLLAVLSASGQNTANQQLLLNNYVEYANRSAGEVSQVIQKAASYYPRIRNFQKTRFANPPRWECQGSPEEYEYNKALNEGKKLLSPGLLNQKIAALHNAAAGVDIVCKRLDTYHKLEDYKQDGFKQAEVLIDALQKAVVEYRSAQNALAGELENLFQKFQSPAPANPNYVADKMMKKEIARERSFMDKWSLNINDGIRTQSFMDQVPGSILETQSAVNLFKRSGPALQYPASSMFSSFQEALGYMLQEKRSGLDGNNYEARQNDQHANEVYLNLINYFNGMMVADKNGFDGFARQNGYIGLSAIAYVPLFEIRTTELKESNEIKPFEDIPHIPVAPIAQAAPISAGTSATLNNYIEFINEAVTQMDYLMRVLRNYNSSARYYKDLKTFKGKGGLTFGHNDYKLPQSVYQSAVTSGTAAAAWRKSLNNQAQVLMNILKEMEQLGIALEDDCDKRNYERDNLTKAYEILERYAVLFEAADQRKEQLYNDVRKIYESWPPASPGGSWSVSSKVLLAITDEDKKQLFLARAFFRGDSSVFPAGASIERQMRDAISAEFANMKGIEQLGRSNGNCPYSPYEDVASNSRTFSEKLAKVRKASIHDTYEGPYHEYIYIYNVIIEDYNKFCELAKINILRNILQPDNFKVLYPEPKKAEDIAPAIAAVPQKYPITDAVEEERPARQKQNEGRVIHDTIKVTDIIRIETRRNDTVYIEKHDTIYRNGNGDKLLSMDGYAANNMVFLLDVSGSMNAGQKLPLLKKSMLLLLKILREEDKVSIVVYSGKSKTVLPPTSAKELAKIKAIIENLRSEGATDGNAGIKLAYKTANGNYTRGGNNRILLATDGEFPVSDETQTLITKNAQQDIYLTVFNFGRTEAAVTSLKKLSELGKGNFENITQQNADVTLIREAKSKKK